jgi:hypothetical protein
LTVIISCDNLFIGGFWFFTLEEKMKQRTYHLVSAAIFAVIGIVHFTRFFVGFSVVVGGWVVPVWFSLVASAVFFALAVQPFGLKMDYDFFTIRAKLFWFLNRHGIMIGWYDYEAGWKKGERDGGGRNIAIHGPRYYKMDYKNLVKRKFSFYKDLSLTD